MIHVGHADEAPDFPAAAKTALENQQLRTNVRRATDVIRAKRALVVGETSRLAGAARVRHNRSRRT